jgi:hypothetical protein
MSAAELGALLAFATAMAFTPGPNTTLSAAIAANRGLGAALPFVLAVPVGWGLMLLASVAGLGALLAGVPLLRGAIKALGLVYLVWLAWRLRGSGRLAEREGGLGVCAAEIGTRAGAAKAAGVGAARGPGLPPGQAAQHPPAALGAPALRVGPVSGRMRRCIACLGVSPGGAMRLACAPKQAQRGCRFLPRRLLAGPPSPRGIGRCTHRTRGSHDDF